MLQQTQVSRVISKWHAFVEKYPTVADCARSDPSDVIALWQGLGYNRRAVQLHRCAIDVVTNHDGTFPDQLATLMTLPGIGAYTARAILTFAYERDIAVLDTNVARIVARAIVGRTLSLREAQDAADSLVPTNAGWLWNQGMLDLGATVCTKRLPLCVECPLARCCVWRNSVPQNPDPAHGSAAVSVPQSRFEGSDRQLRGRTVDVLRKGSILVIDLPNLIGCPDQGRMWRILRSLIADGLIRMDNTEIHLGSGPKKSPTANVRSASDS
jgi:A/G-specific adenine glycosylase